MTEIQGRFFLFLVVFLGGGLGASLRFALYRLLQLWNPSFPWATVAVNLLGSLVFGLFLRLTQGSAGAFAAFVLPGLCGGLTTFSTFSGDLLYMLQNSRWEEALLHTLLNLGLSLSGCIFGWQLARLF